MFCTLYDDRDLESDCAAERVVAHAVHRIIAAGRRCFWNSLSWTQAAAQELADSDAAVNGATTSCSNRVERQLDVLDITAQNSWAGLTPAGIFC